MVDDFVVRRNDGAPAYNLAVVVDDAWQGIGEVVRGDDLLETDAAPALPRRPARARAPAYAHVPLVLGPDGARLAKRHGAVTLDEVRRRPAVAWMARTLGMRPATTAGELLDGFDPGALPRVPTRFAGF